MRGGGNVSIYCNEGLRRTEEEKRKPNSGLNIIWHYNFAFFIYCDYKHIAVDAD